MCCLRATGAQTKNASECHQFYVSLFTRIKAVSRLRIIANSMCFLKTFMNLKSRPNDRAKDL